MTKLVEIQPEARLELIEACTWYDSQELGVGADLSEAFTNALARIEEAPESGELVPRMPKDLEIRRLAVHRFPFRVVYVETPATIRVLAFAHERLRPDYWLGRLRRRR